MGPSLPPGGLGKDQRLFGPTQAYAEWLTFLISFIPHSKLTNGLQLPALDRTENRDGTEVPAWLVTWISRGQASLQGPGPDLFIPPSLPLLPPPTPQAPETDRVEHCISKDASLRKQCPFATLRLPKVAKAGDGVAKGNCIHQGDNHWLPPSPTAKEQVSAGGGTRRPGGAWDGIHVLLVPMGKSLLSELCFPHLYSQCGPLYTAKWLSN